jgi:hypothetical protein
LRFCVKREGDIDIKFVAGDGVEVAGDESDWTIQIPGFIK